MVALLLQEYLVSSVSVSLATICTNPFDVAKVQIFLAHILKAQVRLQLIILQRGSQVANPGIVRTMLSMARNEGVLAFWKGTTAGLMRSMTYGGLRFGLYKPIKNMIGQDTAAQKFVAAMSSGAIASLLTNPAELVKVRMQASTESLSIAQVLRGVVASRGVRGLWAGSLPSVARGAVLTASQCVTYDEMKRVLSRQTAWPTESFAIHFLASILSGLVSTTATNPIDVVKTYMFVNRGRTVAQCVRDIFTQEGPRAFFKGWLASYVRLGPQTTLILLFSEQIRSALSLEHF